MHGAAWELGWESGWAGLCTLHPRRSTNRSAGSPPADPTASAPPHPTHPSSIKNTKKQPGREAIMPHCAPACWRRAAGTRTSQTPPRAPHLRARFQSRVPSGRRAAGEGCNAGKLQRSSCRQQVQRRRQLHLLPLPPGLASTRARARGPVGRVTLPQQHLPPYPIPPLLCKRETRSSTSKRFNRHFLLLTGRDHGLEAARHYFLHATHHPPNNPTTHFSLPLTGRDHRREAVPHHLLHRIVHQRQLQQGRLVLQVVELGAGHLPGGKGGS